MGKARLGSSFLRTIRGKAVIGALATLAITSAAQATITIYNSLGAFNAATSAQGTDTFTGFNIVSSTPSPINRNAGPYTYTANPAPAGTFFGAGTAANPWLSTNTATDTITFNNFGGGVEAAGGNFFGSDVLGSFAAGSVTVTATDGSGTVSQTIVGATTSSFLGFVSDGPLSSLTVAAVQPSSGFLWPTVDNLVLAKAIPEPTTLGLFAAAGAMVLRRRR